MENKPLVSILVITYESADFIIETLESIKNQTYPKIELIVADDCSKDTTVALVKDWMIKNQSSFVKTELVTTEKNTGTSGNCNRGLAKATGEYLKLIAGDDLLVPDCISSCLHYIKTSNDDIKILCSDIDFFGDALTDEIIQRHREGMLFTKKMCALNAAEQHTSLMRKYWGSAPSLIIHRQTLLDLGRFDERVKFIEDYPLWINATERGIKIYFYDKKTVMYRVRGNSVSGSGCLTGNPRLDADFHQVYVLYQREHLSFYERFDKDYTYKLSTLMLSYPRFKIIFRLLKLLSFPTLIRNLNFKIIKIKLKSFGF